ncbi:hypothetical protein [Celeribacter sp.]|uniref:hypothetical protein n=1 Tax=Celeribacter sp. TaxID=1890673 RepID=UPI003A8F3C0C
MKHDIARFAAINDIPRRPHTSLASAPRPVGAYVTTIVRQTKQKRSLRAHRPRAAHTLRAWLAHEVAACRNDAELQHLIIERGYAIHIGCNAPLICTSDGEPICFVDALKPAVATPS